MWYNDVKKGFGLAIKIWRGKCGISQEELAWRAGLHRTYVADIERGARNPSLLSLEKIARALKISFSTLFEPMQNFPAGEAEAAKREPVEILLVEDNVNDAESAVRAFREAHVTNHIHVAHDGAEAIEYLWHSARWENPALKHRPRLVLLALDLPKIEGIEVLRRIKSDPLTRNIPVIVLTVTRDNRHLPECRRLGVELYLTKPMDLARFCALLPQLSFVWGLLGQVDNEGPRPEAAAASAPPIC